MTFTEFTLYAVEYDQQHHKERSGQAAFNALWHVRPDLAKDLPLDCDPFYQDALLPQFWAWVGANW